MDPGEATALRRARPERRPPVRGAGRAQHAQVCRRGRQPCGWQAVGPACTSGIAITAAPGTRGLLSTGRRWAHTTSVPAMRLTGPLLFWPGGPHDQLDYGPGAHKATSVLAGWHTRTGLASLCGTGLLRSWPCVAQGHYVSGRGCPRARTFLALGAARPLRCYPAATGRDFATPGHRSWPALHARASPAARSSSPSRINSPYPAPAARTPPRARPRPPG